MTEFTSTSRAPLPEIPDDLSIPQFMLDYKHPCMPYRPENVPWLTEDHSGRSIGFQEIKSRTHGLANAMSIKWNIRQNDVVCIFSPNHTDYPICVWATHTLGAIITPANPGYTADELVHQLRTTKATLIFVHSDALGTVLTAARRARIPEDRIVLLHNPQKPIVPHGAENVNDLVTFGLGHDTKYMEKRFKKGESKRHLAFLSFSSGTTGKPKAVSIPHYSVIANIIQVAAHYSVASKTSEPCPFSPGDVATAVLPFFHIYGLVVNMHFMLFAGLNLVVIPKFSFTDFLGSIVRHRITHLLLVPPQIVLMCKHPAMKGVDLSHVRWTVCGAAPLSGELVKQVIKVLPNASIGQGYGLTETCTSIAMYPPEQRIGTIGSAGTLIPGVRARIVKADGSLGKAGEVGELVVTGPSMSLGYPDNAQATKETFIDGWVRTGDEVMINENSELFVLDRVKEILKVRGYQVAPAELEGHLLMHPYVTDACVVSVLDEYSGELPLAYVVLDKSVKEHAKDHKSAARLRNEIAKHVSDTKVQYKWLAGGVEFIDAIPKNPSGKILRRVLRDKARAARANVRAPLQAKL
ncbi:phenylacetyl-CoA ligase [Pleurotus eryngii]|uniref:Phenylacetyl-CoA ligase n=1 Tax=Pleurotus eryngii TaxID=5323 RepID=A0A9P6A959_PLEER|nr:phenylacetyl-CoA ligase [Pleurotus eryngii]